MYGIGLWRFLKKITADEIHCFRLFFYGNNLSSLSLAAVLGVSVQPTERVSALRGRYRQALQQHTRDLQRQPFLLARPCYKNAWRFPFYEAAPRPNAAKRGVLQGGNFGPSFFFFIRERNLKAGNLSEMLWKYACCVVWCVYCVKISLEVLCLSVLTFAWFYIVLREMLPEIYSYVTSGMYCHILKRDCVTAEIGLGVLCLDVLTFPGFKLCCMSVSSLKIYGYVKSRMYCHT